MELLALCWKMSSDNLSLGDNRGSQQTFMMGRQFWTMPLPLSVDVMSSEGVSPQWFKNVFPKTS